MSTRVALTSLVLLLLASCGWPDAQLAETKRRGDMICRAIEAYRARTGRVPEELKALQPDILREIPQPTVGKKRWIYATSERGQSYNLEVAIGAQSEPLLQTQSEGSWSFDTK